MKEIKEIVEAFGTRVKSPLLGYFTFALIAKNWKPSLYLMLADEGILDRINYFEKNTDAHSLLFFPLIFAVCFAIAYPWISYIFLLASAKPTNLKNYLNAQAESSLLLKKAELEENRNALIRAKEKRAIDEARLEEEIEKIKDEELREKTRLEVEKIRRESEGIDGAWDLSSLEKKRILNLPINNQSLKSYSNYKFPEWPISEQLQHQLLKDINKGKYKTINDIDKVFNDSEKFLEFYKKINPKVFNSSTDFLTKSLGYSDAEFRARHGFSNETLEAIDNFIRMQEN